MSYNDLSDYHDTAEFNAYFGWLWGCVPLDDPTPVTEHDPRPSWSGVIIVPRPAVTPRPEMQDNGRGIFDPDKTQEIIVRWDDDEEGYKQ